MPSKTIIAEFDVAPGAYDNFSRIMRDHARVTRETEPGCTAFDIIRVTDANGATDKRKLVLVESYASEEAYIEHTKQPRMPALRDSYAGMLTDRRVVRGYVD
jgi:quinol monooxygenase YgiN